MGATVQHVGDHDGKSKSTASMDLDHYPDPGEAVTVEPAGHPSHADVALRAYELWVQRGTPCDSAECDWLEAERELKAAANSRKLIEQVHEHAGSVQS